MDNAEFVGNDGRLISIHDFRGEDVIISVWATWCAPCVIEIPYLDKLYTQMKEQHVNLLPISVDQSGIILVREFYEENGIDHLPLFNDSGIDLLESLEIGPIPALIAINTKGVEVGRSVGLLPIVNSEL